MGIARRDTSPNHRNESPNTENIAMTETDTAEISVQRSCAGFPCPRRRDIHLRTPRSTGPPSRTIPHVAPTDSQNPIDSTAGGLQNRIRNTENPSAVSVSCSPRKKCEKYSAPSITVALHADMENPVRERYAIDRSSMQSALPLLGSPHFVRTKRTAPITTDRCIPLSASKCETPERRNRKDVRSSR